MSPRDALTLWLRSHEYISGYYRVSVYFLSKILSDILTLRTIPAIVFSCVAYFMIGGQQSSPKISGFAPLFGLSTSRMYTSGTLVDVWFPATSHHLFLPLNQNHTPTYHCSRLVYDLGAGLKPTAEAFFLFMFTVTLVAYTATAMALAISADQTVVAIANIFMTIACVFMMVTLNTAAFSRLGARRRDQWPQYRVFRFRSLQACWSISLPSSAGWLG